MPEERETLRLGVAWSRGIADAARRALGRCDPDQEIDLGADFRVGLFGRPGECGVNLIARNCWPGADGPGTVVRMGEVVSALALLDEIAGLVQKGLESSLADPETLGQIRSRIPPSP